MMESLHDTLHDRKSAAAYCGMQDVAFLNQHKLHRGPTYIRLTPRRIRFRQSDLDRWLAGRPVVQRP